MNLDFNLQFTVFLCLLVTTHSYIKCVGTLKEKNGPPVEDSAVTIKQARMYMSQH